MIKVKNKYFVIFVIYIYLLLILYTTILCYTLYLTYNIGQYHSVSHLIILV